MKKSTAKFEFCILFQKHPPMLAPIQTTGFPHLTVKSKTTAAWIWKKNSFRLLQAASLRCFVFFVATRGWGTCSSGERTVTSKMGCLGIVQGDFSKKSGHCPKKGNLFNLKNLSKGLSIFNFKFICELERHCQSSLWP